MKHKTTLILFTLLIFGKVNGQFLEASGSIQTEIASMIAVIPPEGGNNYFEPDASQLRIWEALLGHLLDGNYAIAADSATAIDYELVKFTDTRSAANNVYYLLRTTRSNHWGTYVFNPEYCRPLVIQSPHAIKDANTGLQGIHVFHETGAMFYQVNGVNRCNSLDFSSCSGTTSVCSGSSEPYRNSDLAHVTQSLFQKTTEVLLNAFDDTYFIQLHGFGKRDSDPYVILSNGTQETPAVDYMATFRTNLSAQDPELTFQVAHLNTSWTRLRGFFNTQGRLINGGEDACGTNATSTNGRFFHVEQERSRLRDDANGWNKIANALKRTFPCGTVSVGVNAGNEVWIYPNPATDYVTMEGHAVRSIDEQHFIYNLGGANLSCLASVTHKSESKVVIDLSALPAAFYLFRLGDSVQKVRKR